MNAHRTPKTLLAALCTAAGLAASANPALAQCDIYRLNVPDFDQRREAEPANLILGLPSNGGLHCVPTSYANWVGYMNNHGYPDFFGQVMNWSTGVDGDLGQYNIITQMIYDFGVRAGTAQGTDMGDGAAAMQQYFDEVYPGEFISVTVKANGTYAPTTEEMYEAMADGKLVTFGTTRYTPVFPSNGFDLRFVVQKGGHAQSLIRLYDACAPSPTLYTRDPAGDEGNRKRQSPFSNTIINSHKITFGFADSETEVPVTRTMLRLNPLADYWTFITAVTYFTPKCGLTADAVLGRWTIYGSVNKDLSIKPPHTHGTPGNIPIVGFKMHPQLGRAIVVADSGGAASNQATILRTRLNGDVETLGTLADAAATPNTPCVFGKNGEFYIADGSVVRALDVSGPALSEMGSFTIPGGGISAMTYDDTHDRVVIVCSSRGVIGECSAVGNARGFGADYGEMPIPAGVPLAGDTFAACSPIDGSLLVCSQGSSTVFRLEKTVGAGGYGSTAMLLPAVQCCPRALAVDHRGHVSFIAGGVLNEFRPNPAGGWEVDPDSKFGGLAVGDFFEQTAARNSGSDPAVPGVTPQTVPPEREFDAEQVDCRADFNASNTLSVQDLFDFLAAYFGNSVDADFNQSGAVSVQDIFDYLAAYFAGCP